MMLQSSLRDRKREVERERGKKIHERREKREEKVQIEKKQMKEEKREI